VIHATNAWNPTGQNLLPVPGTRLSYLHALSLSGPRTYVFLGSQQHLTFVADLEEHIAPELLRARVLESAGLYPYLVDLPPAPNQPRPGAPEPAIRPSRP
jgi:hypothetical protein